jgi:hypothetical protein
VIEGKSDNISPTATMDIPRTQNWNAMKTISSRFVFWSLQDPMSENLYKNDRRYIPLHWIIQNPDAARFQYSSLSKPRAIDGNLGGTTDINSLHLNMVQAITLDLVQIRSSISIESARITLVISS